MDGKPLRQTAIELGLSPRTASSQASHIIKHAHDDGSYLRILEERGVTDDFLAGKLRSLLDAKHTIWAQYMGTYSDSRQVEALETQRKALELAHKLRGHLRESAGPSVEIGLMQMVLQVVRDGGDFTSSGKSGADNE